MFCPILSIVVNITIDIFGRKAAIILNLFIHISGWILEYLNFNFYMILTGQILVRSTSKTMFYPVRVYQNETICADDNKLRRISAPWPNIIRSFGLVSVFSVGYLTDCNKIPVVIASLSIVILIIIYVVFPESPTWLKLHGRIHEARQATETLGIANTVYKSMAPIEDPALALAFSTRSRFGWQAISNIFTKLSQKNVRDAIILMSFLSIVNNFSGGSTLMIYLAELFPKENPTSSDEYYSFLNLISYGAYTQMTICAFFVFVAQILMIFTLPHFGARKLFMIAGVCMCFGLLSVGYTAVTHNTGVARILAIWVVLFAFNSGVQSILNTVISDVLPPDAQSFGTIPLFAVYASNAIIAKWHPYLYSQHGGYLFYAYACMSFICTILVFFFLPETIIRREEIRVS